MNGSGWADGSNTCRRADRCRARKYRWICDSHKEDVELYSIQSVTSVTATQTKPNGKPALYLNITNSYIKIWLHVGRSVSDCFELYYAR